MKKIELNEKIQAETDLTLRIPEIKSLVQEYQKKLASISLAESKANTQNKLLTGIFSMGELNGLIVESIRPHLWESVSGINIIPIHLIAYGSLLQFMQFMASVKKGCLPFAFSDFNLKAQVNDIFKIDLWLIGYYVERITQEKRVLPDANFLFSPNYLGLADTADKNDLINSVSFKQMRYVGYLEDKNKLIGIVQLPNGRVVEVFPDALIGVENAKVIKLTKKALVIIVEEKEITLFNSFDNLPK